MINLYNENIHDSDDDDDDDDDVIYRYLIHQNKVNVMSVFYVTILSLCL